MAKVVKWWLLEAEALNCHCFDPCSPYSSLVNIQPVHIVESKGLGNVGAFHFPVFVLTVVQEQFHDLLH